MAATEREIDELRLQPGDILMNEGGDRDKLGRGWVWSVEIPECIHQNHVFRVRAFDGVEPRFVSHYANSAGQSHFQSSGRQTTNLASVNKTTLSALSLPLPPSKEQRRIVAKLDAIFEKARAVKARLERLPALLEKLKRSVLAAAFRGDLTKDWRAAHPNVEPADVLRDRIRTERRRCWEDGLRAKGKNPSTMAYAETPKIRGEGLPELPETWCWATVQDIAVFVTDGTHQPPPTTPSGVPFIGIRNIVDSRIDWNSVDRWVSGETYNELTGRFRAAAGDTLYATVGATFGQAVLVEDDREFVFQRHIAHVRAVPSIVSSYLATCLASPHCFAQAREKARGAAQPTVNLADLRNFVIPLPPLVEQQLVVDRATDAIQAIQRVASRHAIASEAVDRLERATLAKAFLGELVPQDPTDEPASVLLDRIRATRTAETVHPQHGRGQLRDDAAMAEGIATVTGNARVTNGHHDETLDLVVGVLQIDRRLTTTAITEATGLDASAVKKALKTLVVTGQVRVHGRARATTYEWSP